MSNLDFNPLVLALLALMLRLEISFGRLALDVGLENGRIDNLGLNLADAVGRGEAYGLVDGWRRSAILADIVAMPHLAHQLCPPRRPARGGMLPLLVLAVAGRI